jgi:hypothetical protein
VDRPWLEGPGRGLSGGASNRGLVRHRLALVTQAAVGVLVAVVVAACSKGSSKPLALPPVPFNTTTTASTTTVDYSGVDLAPVAGRPALFVALGPGTATLKGTVTGPNGPVAGATIHIERIVDDVIGSTNVTTQADGSWVLAGILGGQYRLRAWRQPDLSESQPDIFFLNGTDIRTETLPVQPAPGNEVTFSLAPRAPIVGHAAQLALQVSVGMVDSNGIVRVVPRAGVPVEVSSSSGWQSESGATTTRGDGTARLTIACSQLGAESLAVVVNNVDVFPLGAPSCLPVPAPTTSTSSPTTTITPGSPTTLAP